MRRDWKADIQYAKDLAENATAHNIEGRAADVQNDLDGIIVTLELVLMEVNR